MDIGSQTLYQLISDKVLATRTSKLCVLGVGLKSSHLAALTVTTMLDKTHPVNFIVANRDQDISTLQTALSQNQRFQDHSVGNTKKLRAKRYQEGGTFLITNMKFALDVLEELIDPTKVDRIILVNEYEVSEYNPLAFAVNIIKRVNESVQTIAFINDPFHVYTQSNFEKLMKNLYLGDCQFWPFYREEIKDFLSPSTTIQDNPMTLNTVEEIFVKEPGKVLEYQKTVIELLRKALECARKDFCKVTTEPFPIITPDLTEMSNSEFTIALRNMPTNFNSDFVFDLHELRRILGSFGHHSKLRVLRAGASYQNRIRSLPQYKGLCKFPRNEKEIFDDLMHEILTEMVQVVPCDPLPDEKVAALQVYAKETIGLDREVTTFSHKLMLNLKRPPKLQLLFDLVWEASEKNRGITDSSLHESRILIVCHDQKVEELWMLIQTYFGSGKSASSLLDLQLLLYHLTSGDCADRRQRELRSSSVNTFERALLEQRLCDEIVMILESGRGLLSSQVNNPQYNKVEFQEIHIEEDQNSYFEQTISYAVFNEQTIHQDLKILKADFDTLVPEVQAKLLVIPEKLSLECLKMVKMIEYEDNGRFKVNPFVVPGVQLMVTDIGKVTKEPKILEEFKPHQVIMFDHSNSLIRYFQICRLIDHHMQVSILVGENYLEGWLYKNREKREEEIFTRLIKDIARLHGVKSRAEDRVRLDSGLKSLKNPKEKETQEAKATKGVNKDGPPLIIDKREFNSDCPGLLYFNGYQTIPMFLKTGDYILYNHMAIERKAFNDFKQSVLKGRLEVQIKQMKEVFSRIYILIEFFDGHSIEELNRWLSIRRISDSISVYRNMRSSKFVLNFAGLIQLYSDRYPQIRFLYSFRPQDTLAYFKYLMKQGGTLDVGKFGDFSNKIEAKPKKIKEYFDERKPMAETAAVSKDAPDLRSSET